MWWGQGVVLLRSTWPMRWCLNWEGEACWVRNSHHFLDHRGHTFSIPTVEVDRLKLTFEDTTDFFGRVVVYHLRVLGEKAV